MDSTASPKALQHVYNEQGYKLRSEDIAAPQELVKITHPAVILVPEGQARLGPGAELLGRILSACGLERTACLVLEDPPGTSLVALERRIDTRLIVVFGRRPADLGLQILAPSTGSVQFRGKHLVFAPDLEALAGDQAAKKALWAALQQAVAESA